MNNSLLLIIEESYLQTFLHSLLLWLSNSHYRIHIRIHYRIHFQVRHSR